MTICARTDPHPCSLGCEMRQAGGFAIAPSAMPSRHNRVAPPAANPVWERQIITDKRPDGTEMPIFRPGTTEPLRIKEYTERKREIDDGIRRLKAPAQP